MASQQTVVPVGVKTPMEPGSCPLELSVARETAQETASPTSRLVRALKGAGLQNSDGRPSSPSPSPKSTAGDGGKGRPPHSHPVPQHLETQVPSKACWHVLHPV